MRQIVVMPGGFHPFHAGHASLYQSAIKAFPDADVYVAATNDTKTRPFPFKIKEKLAKVAGVAPGHFVQVKSPFKAEEITSHYNPDEDVLIFVRSEKDKNEQPKPGGTKKDGTSAYFQPWTGKDLQPFSQHAYMAYLPTVEFGPGITSATEIRNAWPKLSDKRKIAMVMSLYPATQKNPKLAANVVQLLDMGMGNELDEGWKEKIGAAALAGGVALGGLSSMGNASDTNWDKFPQQMRTQQDNSGNEKIMSVAGPNSKGEYRVRITAGNDVHEFITKTPPKGLKEEFRPSTSQAMNIQRQTRQKMNPGTNRFVWKRPNQISGSHTENELKSLNFKYSAKYNMWGGTQQMWDRLTSKVNEFAPPSSGRDDGGGENERSRRIRKLLEIAIQVAKEKNVDELGMIHGMNMIAGDDFFNTAVEGILPDITDKEYMFVLQSAYKTVKQGLAETINSAILNKKFKHKQVIGDYTYTATAEDFEGSPLLWIKAYHGNKEIGHILFEIIVRSPGGKRKPSADYIESGGTEVDPAYRDKGVASTMYAYAKMLGNDIQASYNQTSQGKAMWKAWEKAGDAKHLVGTSMESTVKINEFAPLGSDDREPDEEEILRQLAAQWWNGTEQQMKKAQQTLELMGWEIGQDESGDDDAGVFVIRIGDEHGDSYIAFPHSDLGLNEDYLDEK